MLPYLASIILVIASFSKAEYFKTFEVKEKSSMMALEKKLKALDATDDQKAYLGALTMTNAEFEGSPINKLNKFKEGKELLENAIKSQEKNVEYRFLRLMIQENAPKFLKYTSNISTDAQFIANNIEKAPKDVKQFIVGYASKSSNLKL